MKQRLRAVDDSSPGGPAMTATAGLVRGAADSAPETPLVTQPHQVDGVPAGQNSSEDPRGFGGTPSPWGAADRWVVVVAALAVLAVVVAGGSIVVLNQRLVDHAPAFADTGGDEWTSLAGTAVLLCSACLILAKVPRHPIGWLLLAMSVLGVGGGLAEELGRTGLHLPGHLSPHAGLWALLSQDSFRPVLGMAFLVLLIFPDGHPPSRRWGLLVWTIPAVFGLWTVVALLRPGPLGEDPFRNINNPLGVPAFANPVFKYAFLPAVVVLGVLVLTALVVRFRGSSGDERQQLKWVGVAAGGIPLSMVAVLVAAPFGRGAMNAAGNAISVFLLIALPAALVVAVTRYRLYDLDLFVNRTVVYGSLSVFLVGVYGLMVVASTRLVVQAGVNSPGVVAVATLVAALLANPARRRIQNVVDRVFLRRAWTAGRQVEQFTARWQDAPQPPSALTDLVRTALGDPTAEVGLWLRNRQAWSTPDGQPLVAEGHGRARLEVNAHGERLAIVLHDPSVGRDRRLVDAVSRRARLILDNSRLQAEILTQLQEVRRSRARIVEAADAERQRVERNLHDGAQQRLVGLALSVELARRAHPDPVLAEIADELAMAVKELRELARGIRPTALNEGLAAALDAQVARWPIPVTLDIPAERFPPSVEATAYYVACEAVTNAMKHADARHLTVTAAASAGQLCLVVRDDGRGGADPNRGSGLSGLSDRMSAAGGILSIDSPLNGGTTVTATIPCES